MKTPNGISRRELLTGGLATIIGSSVAQGDETGRSESERDEKNKVERTNIVSLTAKDSNELTQPDTTYVLQNDVFGGYCFLARAPHITLDLNGHTINGDQSGTIGFFGDKLDDLIIRNGVINNVKPKILNKK